MNISAKIVYGLWQWGGSTCYLVFVANQDFVAVDGEIIKQGIYRRVVCTITDSNNITIPLITSIPTTTDSTSDRDSTWSTYFETVGHGKKSDWLIGFKLNHVDASPVEWEAVFLFNNPPGFEAGPDYGISYPAAVLLIQEAIASSDVIARGIGTLLANDVTVIETSEIELNSPVEFLPMTLDITGRIRMIAIEPGVSFTVSSENATDAGNFKWYIKT